MNKMLKQHCVQERGQTYNAKGSENAQEKPTKTLSDRGNSLFVFLIDALTLCMLNNTVCFFHHSAVFRIFHFVF